MIRNILYCKMSTGSSCFFEYGNGARWFWSIGTARVYWAARNVASVALRAFVCNGRTFPSVPQPPKTSKKARVCLSDKPTNNSKDSGNLLVLLALLHWEWWQNEPAPCYVFSSYRMILVYFLWELRDSLLTHLSTTLAYLLYYNKIKANNYENVCASV